MQSSLTEQRYQYLPIDATVKRRCSDSQVFNVNSKITRIATGLHSLKSTSKLDE